MRRTINAGLPLTALVICLGVIAWIATNSPGQTASEPTICHVSMSCQLGTVEITVQRI
ncbi:hypothetical protein [Aestuariivita sp.]|jgi:hypothetical protein|uniref:hypothetical protein n=1 Tax=Aestuariivita sp. TaxID=1872407 RepID=UPI002171D155|nr:hypothetical protein [Aestuariivita sp.]MCE8007512.1 hypothetical protein [Aestuariivita sp.]